MRKQKEATSRPAMAVAAAAEGLVSGIIFIAVALCVGALIMSHGAGVSSANVITVATVSAASLISALISSGSFGHAGLIMGAASALLLFFLLVILGFAVNSGVNPSLFTDLIFMLVSGMIGGALGVRRVSRGK